jgi:hypothetical protein
MKNFSLNIAGYIIRFESVADDLELVPAERFRRNITGNKGFDIRILVHAEKSILPENAKPVFSAPYFEETNGIRLRKSDQFWSVFKLHEDLYIKAIFPLSPGKKSGLLKFSLITKVWDLRVDGTVKEFDPMEYPLDGLILYYLTVLHSDIMIHASGVNYAGYGYVFSGISGSGKTTMARIWDKAGARVIHDDRLILRNTADGFKMFNTPVYKNDAPSESPLNKIFIIDHGNENELIPVNGAPAVSLVIANCIQHNWDPQIIRGLLNSVSELCAEIPVANLRFRPDSTIIDVIRKNEGTSR